MNTITKLLNVINEHPTLTRNGFEDPDSFTEENRMALFAYFEEFDVACEWLKNIKPKKTTSGYSSYALKHYCERKQKHYVSNGSMIAAAIHSGFKLNHTGNSLNCNFNMTKKSVKNNMTDEDRYLCN